MSVAPGKITAKSMTWEEYVDLGPDVRGEYIDGALVMSPPPPRQHQQISQRLLMALAPVLAPGLEITLAWGWKVGREEFIPDLMVHPVTEENLRFTGTPLLAVEVLSSNRSDDLVRKATKYAAAGLPSYWIIDPRDRVLIAYELRDGVFEAAAQVEEAGSAEILFGETTLVVDLKELLDGA